MTCRCVCHVGSVQSLHIPPDVRDPIAAVTACSQCIRFHCPALLDGPRAVELPPTQQGDGFTYWSGDGPE